jgi:hypothetical protein
MNTNAILESFWDERLGELPDFRWGNLKLLKRSD